jgi:hypothetical protein
MSSKSHKKSHKNSNKKSHKKSVIITKIETIKNNVQWDGYKIEMSDDSKNIICKIDNRQDCCEVFGIFSPDSKDFDKFIGAKYLSVNFKVIHPDNDLMNEFVVTIHTNKGDIKLILYNQHEGYYPHDIYFQSENETSIFSI